MTKYYFAYHSVNGQMFPFRWSETNGVSEGGNWKATAIQMREISSHEYVMENLTAITSRYPFQEVKAN